MSLFRKEVLVSNKRKLWGNVLVVQPISYHFFTAFFVIIAIISILFVAVGTYTQKENVIGYIAPHLGEVKIYSHKIGIVQNVEVKQGESVAIGDPLVTISTLRKSGSSDDVDKLLLGSITEDLSREKQRKLLLMESNKLDRLNQLNQIENLKKEIPTRERQIILKEERVEISTLNYKKICELNKEKLISNLECNRYGKEKVDNGLALEDAKLSLGSVLGNIISLQLELDNLSNTLALEISDVDRRISALEQLKIELMSKLNYSISSPVDGRVTSISVIEGQNIDSRSQIVNIFPTGSEFIAILLVPSRTIGFIEVGQNVIIRYISYPYQRYGSFGGKVLSIDTSMFSSDELDLPVQTEEAFYRVFVELESQSIEAFGKTLKLRSGMKVNATILLDEISILDWIFDPMYSN